MVLRMKISKTTISLAVYLIISSAFMRQVLNFVLDILGKTGLAIMLWVVFLLSGGAILCYFLKSRFSIWRVSLLLGIFALGLFYASQVKIIEERMHLINFGLLGWLVMRDVGKLKKGFAEVGFSLFFCIFVAIIEETFQAWLPYRVGEVHDVLLAAMGSAWGISLFCIKKERQGRAYE